MGRNDSPCVVSHYAVPTVAVPKRYAIPDNPSGWWIQDAPDPEHEPGGKARPLTKAEWEELKPYKPKRR